MLSKAEKKLLFEKLEIIDATLEVIIQRQWYIASVAYLHDNEEVSAYMMAAMSDTIDEYKQKVKDIRTKYEGK